MQHPSSLHAATQRSHFQEPTSPRSTKGRATGEPTEPGTHSRPMSDHFELRTGLSLLKSCSTSFSLYTWALTLILNVSSPFLILSVDPSLTPVVKKSSPPTVDTNR